MNAEENTPEGMVVGRRFLVKEFIARGNFGQVYLGENINTKAKVAIKMEKKDVLRSQLTLEYSFYKKLRANSSSIDILNKGIPRALYFGECGPWSALVMDLLGPSLEEVHKKCGHIFTVKTTIQLTLQLIDLFEYFHERQLIYRDIKPENFMLGLSGTDRYSTVHIVDLGLCKEYIDEDTNKHIKFRKDKGMTGTVRYISINNHKGYELSRRDDLEAVGYMIIFFVKGELPWQGVPENDVMVKYAKIGRIKEKTKPDQLCSDIPHEFGDYLNFVRNLEFEENPNYSGYKALFNKTLERLQLKNDGIYDFDKNHRPKKR